MGITEQFASVILDDIQTGEISLGVPLRGGAIQIDSIGPTEDGRIDVVRDVEGDITIVNTDGSPLQAEVVVDDRRRPGEQPSRLKVFDSPIDKLYLLHLGYEDEGSGVDEAMWMAAGEGLIVPRINRLIKFVATVGIYGGGKQINTKLKRGLG